jgi:glycosyltransferase involved in cell wall biosynthesis
MTQAAAPGGTREYRVGVVIVAYNAEATIQRVLERIPEPFWSTCAGVWLSDDGSIDATHAAAEQWRTAHPERPLTVVRQPANLGYGGNQKAGYHWAIMQDMDAVVLLHGDGQYAPEMIDELVDPIRAGVAVAVMGSRMLSSGGARRGGMPAYKFVGNLVLTRMQNWITGATLSEWHSGYRTYSVEALKAIPFDSNSDGFDFDTEILLQLMSLPECRIAEVAIPTYYGREISHVNGLRYGWDVMVDVVAWSLQRKGFGSGRLWTVPNEYHVPEGGGSSRQDLRVE